MVIWAIATNSFRELIRDRILYALMGFGVVFLALSLAVGQLTFTEKEKLSMGLGLAAIQLCLVGLAIFIGGSLVYREIYKKTIYTILARPISRTHFLLGKFLGFTMMQFCLLVGFYFIFCVVNWPLGIQPNWPMTIAFLGIFMETIVIISMTFFFISFASPITAVVFSISFFLVGHWTDNLKHFVEKSGSEEFKTLGKFIINFTPQLEAFNWRYLSVKKEILSAADLNVALLHFFSWTFIFLGFACFIFERRDFD